MCPKRIGKATISLEPIRSRPNCGWPLSCGQRRAALFPPHLFAIGDLICGKTDVLIRQKHDPRGYRVPPKGAKRIIYT